MKILPNRFHTNRMRRIILNFLGDKFGIYITHMKPTALEIMKKQTFDSILTCSKYVLHIGGNSGQEAEHYSNLNLNVLWIEADPEIEKLLSDNLKKYPNQSSLSKLMLDIPGINVEFKVFNNGGLSSSIYSLAENHGFEKLDLQIATTKILETSTVDVLFSQMELSQYSHWVIDVQGSELLVLKGAKNSLKFCRSLTLEVSTRVVYEDGTSYPELKSFLAEHGFIPLWEPESDFHGEIIFLKESTLRN